MKIGYGPDLYNRAETHGHADDTLNALRYIVDAYPGEPLFVIRGRDRRADTVVRYYALLYTDDPAMREQALAHALRFREYSQNNPDQMKFADAYPRWPDPVDTEAVNTDARGVQCAYGRTAPDCGCMPGQCQNPAK